MSSFLISARTRDERHGRALVVTRPACASLVQAKDGWVHETTHLSRSGTVPWIKGHVASMDLDLARDLQFASIDLFSVNLLRWVGSLVQRCTNDHQSDRLHNLTAQEARRTAICDLEDNHIMRIPLHLTALSVLVFACCIGCERQDLSTGDLVDEVNEAGTELRDEVNEAGTEIRDEANEAADEIDDGVESDTDETIGERLDEGLEQASDAVDDVSQKIKRTTEKTLETAGQKLEDAGEKLQDSAEGAADTIEDNIERAGQKLQELGDEARDAAKSDKPQ